jgi:metallophosphoesterase superfamily enzyme
MAKGVKKEIYKCFLEGKSRGKTSIIIPSFLDFTEGTLVNDYNEDYFESFSICTTMSPAIRLELNSFKKSASLE